MDKLFLGILTTGLESETDPILEIAARVGLRGPEFHRPIYSDGLDRGFFRANAMARRAEEQGILDRIQMDSPNIHKATNELVGWLDAQGIREVSLVLEHVPTLVEFLQKYMPQLVVSKVRRIECVESMRFTADRVHGDKYVFERPKNSPYTAAGRLELIVEPYKWLEENGYV